MKSNTAAVFFVLALSVMIVHVRCADEDDDASVVIAASYGENGNVPESDNLLMQCRNTEVYSDCNANPMCQRTCDTINQSALPCPKRTCIGGCVCRPKFVRSELYGGCIPEDQCGRVRH